MAILHLTHISGVEPTVFDGLVRKLGILKIALKNIGSLGEDFAVFGDFDKTLGHVVQKGPSLQPSTAEFFEDAVDAALEGDKSELVAYERLSGLFRLLDRSFLLWLGISALFVLV